LNDWTFAGVYTARTGHPFNVTDSGDDSFRDERPEYGQFAPGGYHALPSNRHRLAKVAEWFNIGDVCTQGGTYWLNGVAGGTQSPAGVVCGNGPPTLANPSSSGYGNIPRNFFTAPAYINTTMSVRRIFDIPRHVGWTFDLQVEAINVFNTPNLGNPATGLPGANAPPLGTVGEILATAGSNNAVLTNGRRVQLGGTLRF